MELACVRYPRILFGRGEKKRVRQIKLTRKKRGSTKGGQRMKKRLVGRFFIISRREEKPEGAGKEGGKSKKIGKKFLGNALRG